MKVQNHSISRKMRWAYGLGSVGDTFYFGIFNTFIAIFYNQAIGLPNTLIGTAIMLSLIGDAISDPLVGIISDNWRSKWGRRHPFLFVAPIPLALSIFFIFNPPEALTTGEHMHLWLFAWLVVWTIVSRLFATLYSIPHTALGGEITNNPYERSKIFSVNTICGYAAVAMFSFFAWGYFLAGETVNAAGETIPRHLDHSSYTSLVFATCAVVIGTLMFCAFVTMRYIPLLSKPPANQQRMTVISFFGAIFATLKHRNYVFLMLGLFFLTASAGFGETYRVFVNTYFWELTPQDIRWFSITSGPAVLLGAFMAPGLMRRFDRKPVLLTSLIGVVLFAQLGMDLRLLGLFPENGSDLLLPTILILSAIDVFFLGISTVVGMAILADIIDENELHTGLRQEGLFFSARAFFAKAANSFSHFIGGILLDLYVKLPTGAVPGKIDEDTLWRLGMLAGPWAGIASVLSILFYAQYRMTKGKQAEIHAELAKRKVMARDNSSANSAHPI